MFREGECFLSGLETCDDCRIQKGHGSTARAIRARRTAISPKIYKTSAARKHPSFMHKKMRKM